MYPLLFLAAIEGVRRLSGHAAFISNRNAPDRAFRVRLLWWGLAVWLAACVGTAWLVMYNEVADAINPACGMRQTVARDEISALLAQIPATGRVAAATTIAPHMARRNNLVLVLYPTDADWLALRMDGFTPSISAQGTMMDWLKRLLAPGSKYGFVGPLGSQIGVFQRGGSSRLNIQAREFLTRTFEAEDLFFKTGFPDFDITAWNGAALRFTPGDADGTLMFGPYLDLPQGAYRVAFRVRHEADGKQPFALLEVVEDNGRIIRATTPLSGNRAQYEDVELVAELAGLGNVEFRCLKTRPALD